MQAAEDGPFATPHEYKLSAGEAFEPLSINATWDGSAAAGAFLPCCSFYSQDGRLLARTFPAQVAAGDTAEVTYSPFGAALASAAGAGGAGGLQFDVDPQEGNFLDLNAAQYIHLFARDIELWGFPGDAALNSVSIFGANDSAIQIDAGLNRLALTTGSDRLYLGTGNGLMLLTTTDPAGKIELGAAPNVGGTGGVEFDHGFAIDSDLDTDIANPAAWQARIAVRVNGAGKRELVVIFGTGGMIVLATEP